MTPIPILKQELNISSKDIVETLSQEFPKFTKVVLSYANNSDDTGVCLTPKAEKLLRDKYGRRKSIWSIIK